MSTSFSLCLIVALVLCSLGAASARNRIEAREAVGASSAFWCSKAPASADDRRPNKDVLKFATYNAEWLFLNGTQCPGGMCPWADKTEALDHLNAVAEVLRGVNADIINLCEVQDCNTLNALAAAIGDHTYLPYMVQGTDTYTGQNVGILTRVDPIVDMQRYQTAGKDVTVQWPVKGNNCNYGQTGGSTTVSKHYWTRIQLQDSIGEVANTISLVGVHLLAMPTDPVRCAQREGQAMVIQQLLQREIGLGYDVILSGDFNDWDAQVLDIKGDLPTSRALDFVKSPGLYNTAAAVANVSTRYSDWYDENSNCQVEIPSEVSTIDHIVATGALNDALTSASYDHSYIKTCNPNDWESDHWPSVATFDVSSLARRRAARKA